VQGAGCRVQGAGCRVQGAGNHFYEEVDDSSPAGLVDVLFLVEG
jgi:hypothetical protein